MGALSVVPSHGDLPSLDDKGWVGTFMGIESRRFEFRLTSRGEGSILVLGKTGSTVGEKLAVKLNFVVEEVMPDGKVVTKTLLTDSLESSQAPAKEIKDVTFSGKVTGDASFEAKLEENRGVISVGGKLLSPGTLKNPVRFAVKVVFPNAYADDSKEDKEMDKKKAKAFEDKIEKDRIQLKWLQGKSPRVSPTDVVDASSKEISGTGIAALGVEFSSYQEKRFELIASPNSMMMLSNTAPQPLNQGFTVIWRADTAKDPEGKARLSVEVK